MKRALVVAIAAIVAVLLVEMVSGVRIALTDTQRGMFVAAVTAAVMAVRARQPAGSRPRA